MNAASYLDAARPSTERDHPLLSVNGLRISSGRAGRSRTIVSGIDFAVQAGETLGIVGESGSGKSMTARALIGLLPPGVQATGSVLHNGRELLGMRERELAGVRGKEIGLMLQDPFTMLNPLMTCGAHVTELLTDPRGRALRRSRRREEAVRRLREVGIRDASVAERYPFQLSGGMRQRIALAAALARDPRLLIADEPSTALDVTTQAEILALLKDLQRSRGMALILITHDLRVAFSVCDRTAVLYAGTLVEEGQAKDLDEDPVHPYTLGLLLSEPRSDRRVAELTAIEGRVPTPDEVSDSCVFADRCAWVRAACRTGRPALAEVAPARRSACIRLDEIRDDLRRERRTAIQPAHVVIPSTRRPLVRIENLQKAYTASRRRQVQALNGVSLEIGVNEAVGLVGESGSGKTTLARCLVGLETPSAGEIAIDGVRATDYAALAGADLRKLRHAVQIVFQDPYSSLNPARSIGSALREAIFVREGRIPNVEQRIHELLERVSLPAEYARRKPSHLSGGERQRVAIARALAVQPKLIICDEPVSALDVSVQAQVLNLFKDLRQELGLSYIFITHDLAVARQVVERLYVLFEGKIVEEGAVDDVLDRPTHPYTAKLLASVPASHAAAATVIESS